MIPKSLYVSGFLSYRDPIEIDFTSFDLACISGSNGAGKSSLLDAITWSLFGVARKRDDSLINMQSGAAEVRFIFYYEGNIYRVQRTLPRGKTTMLEFHIKQTDSEKWRPLTERALRETQARIEGTLRMDYETFINASFFLQGKADQFTQQRPGDRKRILGSILGLEIWEGYRERAAERRKAVEVDITNLDGRLAEIVSELMEEQARKAHLEELQVQLMTLSQARAAQESALENMRRIAATLVEQRRLVMALERQYQASTKHIEELESRMDLRRVERASYTQMLAREGEIEAAYANWQEQRTELSRWEEIAACFHQHETRRLGPLTEIEVARGLLLQEQQRLINEQQDVSEQQPAIKQLQLRVENTRHDLAQVEARLTQRGELQHVLDEMRSRQVEARTENPRLKREMDELKERISQLGVAEGVNCPLCGQPLSPADRYRLLEELSAQGTSKGDQYRTNQAILKEVEQHIYTLETQISTLASADDERLDLAQIAAQLTAQLEQSQQIQTAWQLEGVPRLAEVRRCLAEDDYAQEARKLLAQVDAELKKIGYDAAAHDWARQAEVNGRAVEAEFGALERARAALAPLERELGELESQLASLAEETASQQQEYQQSAEDLARAEAQTPDLELAEGDLMRLQEQENRLRLEVGAARQKVLVLEDLKTRQSVIKAQREELARKVSQFKQLERAFSKDGVPALLIEQVLPQIEARANDLLDRLSGGNMTVRFSTQTAYKDKKRDDMKETLDILISDSAGTRDYELYSGGEAFRVNFAVRLALAEVLAQRAGARLQTLVVDEGFGSQDSQGRQRLIEAINVVRQDFAKILVITHIDELKDAFPNRIEVEKTERGSVVRVL